MRMRRYLLRRLGFALLLVVVVSSAALLLTRLAPGDFITDQGLALDPAARERLRAEFGLDRPIAAQYFSWLRGAVQFDFGRSLLYSRPVSTLLSERALNTAVLATAALLLATAIGIPLGIYSGTRTRGLGRSIVRVVSVLGISVPPLIGSLMLVFIAARTGWFPVGGMTSSGGLDLSWGQWLADLARHLPVPALALGIPLAASLERLQSQAIAAASQRAVRRGQPRARPRARRRRCCAMRGRCRCARCSGLYGVMIASLFSGSFIVEVVTSWPGLGRLMFEALRARDLFLVAGCAATGALFLALGHAHCRPAAGLHRSARRIRRARVIRRTAMFIAVLIALALVAPVLAPYDAGRAFRDFLHAPPMRPHLEGGTPVAHPLVLGESHGAAVRSRSDRAPCRCRGSANPTCRCSCSAPMISAATCCHDCSTARARRSAWRWSPRWARY